MSRAGRHLVAVDGAYGVYRVAAPGGPTGQEGTLRRRDGGGSYVPWVVEYGPRLGSGVYARRVELPATLDLAQAGAIAAELVGAYAAGVAAAASFACPDPGMHGPKCAETRHDERGDCDGQIRLYVASTWVEGAVPGEPLTMCTSHGRQAARRHEVRAA
ncbi:hypothetical protein [Micromonospora sp. NPDC049645]|uniref:hypothetical protein n=1 Tax=Micromonospora sp. NPDC049645 TaxID=3155508 RepID=UPI0034127AC8